MCWIIWPKGQNSLHDNLNSLGNSLLCASLKTTVVESLSEWARVTHPNEEYIPSKIQGGPLSVVPLFGEGGAEIQLIFSLEGMSQPIPCTVCALHIS